METAVQSCLLPSALFSEGVKMYVSVHFLPENIKSPGFKLSAIFCEQLLLGKSPEKKKKCDSAPWFERVEQSSIWYKSSVCET